MNNPIIDMLENRQLRADLPDFRPGDTPVEVTTIHNDNLSFIIPDGGVSTDSPGFVVPTEPVEVDAAAWDIWT